MNRYAILGAATALVLVGAASPTGVQRVRVSDPLVLEDASVASPVLGLKKCASGQVLKAGLDGGYECWTVSVTESDPTVNSLGKTDLSGCTLNQVPVRLDGAWGCQTSIGSSGQKIRTIIPIAHNASTTSTGPVSAGIVYYVPSDYVIAGMTRTVTFEALASLTDGVSGGTVQLYNLSAGSVVTSMTFTSNSPDWAASVPLSLSTGFYEVRFFKTSGAATLLLSTAGLRVDNAF